MFNLTKGIRVHYCIRYIYIFLTFYLLGVDHGVHVEAEFTSGVLYINGVASIRRNEAGKFHVEGCASEEYYRIRDIIYNQFAIV